MKRYEGWDGILEEGEKILWQGRPTTRFHIRLAQIPALFFGMVFSGIALFWMAVAAQAGGLAWMFGLIHLAVGLGIGLVPIILDNIRRRNTWYTLTNRRAFIASDMPVIGRRLKSFPITQTTMLEYRDGDPPSLYFAEEYRRTKNGSRRVRIGFEGIADARDVMKRIVANRESAV